MQIHKPQPGEFYAPTLARQRCGFSGMRWGSITPTDIDAFLDFGNRFFVLIESKHEGAELPDGQRLALERLCDASLVPCVLIVVSHDCPSTQDIDLATTRPLRYRWKGAWIDMNRETTCRELVDSIRTKLLSGEVA